VRAALGLALVRHGVPEQILSEIGKDFTGKFGHGGSASEVMFDRSASRTGSGTC
jgi:hypothetical protein